MQSCGPSLEDQIERLGIGGEETELAKQELLIAKGDAVPVLLEALEDPELAAGRAELAEVLVGLMTRVDDGRIDSSLKVHLISDPDPEARARIAREVGILKRLDFAEAFMKGVDDPDGQVRGEALTALGFIRGSLDPELLITLSEKARLLQNDENRDTRLSARIIVADRVDMWLTEADNQALKGQLAAAESLYHEALAYAPDSKKAHLKLGHHYYDNGQQERSLQVLRDSGWLEDVPVFAQAPVVDGRLDDAIWEEAGKFGPFYSWSNKHNAAIESKVNTAIYVGYTGDALYLAARCADAHPESLKVISNERDHGESWREDIVEFFFDANHDVTSCVRFGINSTGAIVDGDELRANWNRADFSLDLESEAAAHVGEDFWSVEFRLPFGQPEVPKPASGTIWGAAMTRGFRGGDEWSQWTRTYPGMAPIDIFGWFLFE